MSEAFPRPVIGPSQLLPEAGLDAGSAIRVTGPSALAALIVAVQAEGAGQAAAAGGSAMVSRPL